jgi:hypothetical protein
VSQATRRSTAGNWWSPFLLLAVVIPSICVARSSALATEEPEALAEQEYDPTASLTQVQVKDIFTPAEYGTNAQPNTLQIRTILRVNPFSLLPLEQLIRPTIRITTAPKGRGASTVTGYDDMQLLDLFVIPWPNSKETGFRWGFGPYFIFPTASNSRIGRGAWQMGPAAGFSYRRIPGLNIAALLQQATSFAYTSSRSTPASSLTIQPILTYRLGRGWYVKSSDATWKFNLRHNTSTTMPLSAGFGKVWKMSTGLALDTSISGEWMLYRQFSNRCEQFTLNFQLSLLLPNL